MNPTIDKNSADDIVKVGVAGLGRSGWENHVQQLSQRPEEYRIVAVMDPDAERNKEAEQTFGCRSYTDYDRFLADDELDLVVVATPSHLHLSQATAALEAGRDVVCEKPMTPTLAEADQMIRAAERTGQLLTVFQNLRFAPGWLKIREVMDSGALGRIVKVTCRVHKFGRRWDWQTLKKFGGGEINNTASHFVDQVMQLVEGRKPRVFCSRDIALSSGDAEDTCTILIDAPDSPLLQVEVSAVSAYPDEFWYIQGTRGCLKGSPSELRWKTCDIDSLPARPVQEKPTPDRSYNIEELPWSEELTWKVPSDAQDPRQSYYQSLYQTLRHGQPLAVTPESVRQRIAVLDACHAD